MQDQKDGRESLAASAPGAPVRASETAFPLYQVVKQQITDAILLGHWPAGTVLPNEIALADRFGVAVGTLRRALADLTQEGLLSRRRKTGTVVTGRTPQHSLRFLFRYFRLHGADGALQESRSINLSLERELATTEEREGLALAEWLLRDGRRSRRLSRGRWRRRRLPQRPSRPRSPTVSTGRLSGEPR